MERASEVAGAVKLMEVDKQAAMMVVSWGVRVLLVVAKLADWGRWEDLVAQAGGRVAEKVVEMWSNCTELRFHNKTCKFPINQGQLAKVAAMAEMAEKMTMLVVMPES